MVGRDIDRAESNLRRGMLVGFAFSAPFWAVVLWLAMAAR